MVSDGIDYLDKEEVVILSEGVPTIEPVDTKAESVTYWGVGR